MIKKKEDSKKDSTCEQKELTDEQLEYVVGGMSCKTFNEYVVKLINKVELGEKRNG